SRKSPEYTTLRKRCRPGTIAIILAGRFRGRRAVILKQLPGNGPLVVSGPMKYNGVPIRRIDSRYLIATSTKVDVKDVDVSGITADIFARPKQEKRVKSEGEFMGDKAKKAAERKGEEDGEGGPEGDRQRRPGAAAEAGGRRAHCGHQEGPARQGKGRLPSLRLHHQAG
ncbi:60S ribosomal protein L6, partial [Trypanosoma conorhini]